MRNFFRAQDGLGAAPQMTYKRKETFGTGIGGFCTTLANVFIFTYLVIVIYGFFSVRSFSTAGHIDFLPITDRE